MQPEFLATVGRLFNGPALIDARHSDSVGAAVISWVRTLGSSEGKGATSDVPKTALVPSFAQPAAEWVRYSVQDGIAYFPIKGTLGWLWNDYQSLALEFRTALADPAIKGIMFVIDSPGGLVAKLFDFVDEIRAARGTKPVWALCNELATSAAYAIASAADRIIVPRTGDVGSVGVVMLHMSLAGALKEVGVEITPIFAGSHKVDGNWWTKLPKAVRDGWQAEIAESWDLFAGTVAENRGMSLEDVQATEALVYTGQHAVDIGFADEVMTAAEAAAAFALEVSGPRSGLVAPAAATPSSQTEETSSMADAPKTPPAGAENQPAPAGSEAAEQGKQPVKGGSQQQGATPGADGDPAGTPAPQPGTPGQPSSADAVAAERTRVKGILALEEAKGRSALAQHFATNTDMSVEDAKAALAVSPKESTGSLAAAMSGVENPDVGADGGESAGEADEADKMAASIIKSTRSIAGAPVKGD
jgi:signal peptide peptidase SppA